jgi:hypothetical protein
VALPAQPIGMDSVADDYEVAVVIFAIDNDSAEFV